MQFFYSCSFSLFLRAVGVRVGSHYVVVGGSAADREEEEEAGVFVFLFLILDLLFYLLIYHRGSSAIY